MNRKAYAERVEYTLAEMGYHFKPILDAMWNWGENYKEKVNH